MTGDDEPTPVGVIGVGSMGQNHARVYRELPGAQLVGVHDADRSRAADVAAEYGTTGREMGELLARCAAVSVAVPTRYHYETVRECIDAGVDVLVEKPFVADPEAGRRLVEFADERDVVLQVGHVERFNPAVQSLLELAADLEVHAVDAHRLGPPVDRQIEESVVRDLMIHDVDVLLALLGGEVAHVDAVGTSGGEYASANLRFDSGVVGQLTASRLTQEKVRRLTLSATDCRVTVDYIDQSIEISRQSAPEYVREDGGVTYRHESVRERVSAEQREPLKAELDAFLDAARTGAEPVVTGEDGLRALELTRHIDRLATDERAEPAPVRQ